MTEARNVGRSFSLDGVRFRHHTARVICILNFGRLRLGDMKQAVAHPAVSAAMQDASRTYSTDWRELHQALTICRAATIFCSRLIIMRSVLRDSKGNMIPHACSNINLTETLVIRAPTTVQGNCSSRCKISAALPRTVSAFPPLLAWFSDPSTGESFFVQLLSC